MTVRDIFGGRLGVPSSLTVATNDRIARLTIASMSAVIFNHGYHGNAIMLPYASGVTTPPD